MLSTIDAKNKINTAPEVQLEKRGLYTLQGVEGESAVTIMSLGLIEVPKNTIPRDTKIDRYQIMDNVYGEIYACNILDKYLLSSKKQPVLYATVIYEKAVIKSYLFNIYIFFNIESEVKSVKDLIGGKLQGKFTTEVIIDKQSKQIDSENAQIKTFESNKKINTKLMNFTKSAEIKEIIQELVKLSEQERINRMGFTYDDYKIPTVTKRI